jgi:hypothetical protein
MSLDMNYVSENIAHLAPTLVSETIADLAPTLESHTIKSNTTSFCLLMKDDNHILNEWIAYHYHVLNLRHIIIALDPSSTTSPEPLLAKWSTLFGMTFEIWRDDDYMPDFFLEGKYDLLHSYVEEWAFASEIYDTDQRQHELTRINNHRFRQITFVSHCLRSVEEKLQEDATQKHWVAHVDTDEYIVINPLARSNPKRTKLIELPQVPEAGSVLEFLSQVFARYPVERLRRSCLLMP